MSDYKQYLLRILTLAVLLQLAAAFPSSKTNGNTATPTLFLQGTTEVFITDIELARDDGAGRAGQTVKAFRTKDNPIHCLVTLSRAAEGTRVRFIWTALDAGGKRDEVLATTEVVTKAGETVADGQLSLPREWPTGRYRVRAIANNRSSKTLDFQIE
jgi:hypothetical protein